jgi:hypothetical protein
MSYMERVLPWIGFDVQVKREKMMAELGNKLSKFLQIKPREMEILAKTIMANRLPANTRVPIGFQQLKKLTAVIHWAKDQHRIGLAFEINGLEAEFLEELAESTQHQTIQPKRHLLATRLKEEKSWDKWEQGLTTSSTILVILEGINGVPPTYAIREEERKEGDVYVGITFKI